MFDGSGPYHRWDGSTQGCGPPSPLTDMGPTWKDGDSRMANGVWCVLRQASAAMLLKTPEAKYITSPEVAKFSVMLAQANTSAGRPHAHTMKL